MTDKSDDEVKKLFSQLDEALTKPAKINLILGNLYAKDGSDRLWSRTKIMSERLIQFC